MTSRRRPLQLDSGTMWDPGGPNVERNNLYKIKVHYKIFTLLSTVVDVDANGEQDKRECSRTEFDSHANMPVVG
jgi:hypothetical protein